MNFIGRAVRISRPPSRYLVASLFLCLLAFAPSFAADSGSITFSLDFPNSNPDHYSIQVQSDGRAHYESSAKISDQSDDREHYQMDFTFSDTTRDHIFELANQAHHFSGKIDSGRKNLAFTGKKTLTYTDGQRTSSGEYNYSPVPAVQQLTTLFQGVSGTLEFGRRLTYYHHYQKLALADELKNMEEEARSGQILEIQAVKPILKAIYDDPSVINTVRARALRLIDMNPAVAASK